jgi:tetraacyldisaccharide 4'-kinase
VNFLAPFGSLYGKISDLRNQMYECGWIASHSLGARTISIGNITTGGTGKTPLVALVAKILANNGEKVCILTRGYGRENSSARILVSDAESVLVDAKSGGDEPVELAQRLLGKAIVVADADRVAAAKWAKENFGVTAFVLDDGFQHRRAKRDLDIVCIDATDPFGNGRVLPAGRLREPLANLKRADAIVITRANLANGLDDLRSEISDLRSNARVLEAKNRIANCVGLKSFHATAQNEQNFNKPKRPFAFCGLGNPQNFFDQLRQDSIIPVGTKSFGDHHSYSAADVRSIESAANAAGAHSLITTAKDAVKLIDLKFEILCYVAELETIIDDEKGFRDLVISS